MWDGDGKFKTSKFNFALMWRHKDVFNALHTHCMPVSFVAHCFKEMQIYTGGFPFKCYIGKMGCALSKSITPYDGTVTCHVEGKTSSNSWFSKFRKMSKRSHRVGPYASRLLENSADLSSKVHGISLESSRVKNTAHAAKFSLSKDLEEKGLDASLQKVVHRVGLKKEFFLTTNQCSGSSSWDDYTLIAKYEPVRRRNIERERREEWEKILYGLV